MQGTAAWRFDTSANNDTRGGAKTTSSGKDKDSMTVSPLSMRQVYCNARSAESCVSPLNNMASVTPHSNNGGGGGGGGGGKMTMEQWMAGARGGGSMRRGGDNGMGMGSGMMTSRCAGSVHSNDGSQVSPNERMEVTRAVYGLLRDNLPPSLESQTTPDVLLTIAESIESKLRTTATSRRAYCSLNTLEFRIKALATAVLIHADREHYERHNGVSDTCVRLSAVTRTSLAYCVMVLVEFEKQGLDRRRNDEAMMMMNAMMMNRQQQQQQGMQIQMQMQQQQGLRRRAERRWDCEDDKGRSRRQQQQQQQGDGGRGGDGNEYRQLALRAAELVEYERMAHQHRAGANNGDTDIGARIAADGGPERGKKEEEEEKKKKANDGNCPRKGSFCVPTTGY